MADALQVANQRRQGYKDAIAKKEAEIAELRDLISELNDFIEFGDALVASGPITDEPRTAPDAIGPATPKDPASQPAGKPAPMSAEDNKKHLARVISQRTA